MKKKIEKRARAECDVVIWMSQEFKRYESIQKKLSGERYLAEKNAKMLLRRQNFSPLKKKSTQNIVQRCV